MRWAEFLAFEAGDSVFRKYRGVVPYVNPFYVEQHVFGDVGGVVGDSL
jgi:hypothetical protein